MQKRIEESELFSNKFGTFAKSDYELLMFTIYLDSLNGDARDYDISIALGITESKVRNLRIKSQLLYPREIDWIRILNVAIANGYYDKNTGMVTITIEDPSVQNLLKNIVEEECGVVGLTLNRKQLVLPIESFIMLATYSEEKPNDVIKAINSHYKKETGIANKIEKKSFKNRFLKEIPNVGNFLGTILSIYTNGRPIIEALVEIVGKYDPIVNVPKL